MRNTLKNLLEYLGKDTSEAPSPIHGHNATTGQQTPMDGFNIIGSKGHGFARTMKEFIYVRVDNHTFTRNIGKYSLPHILDGVLINTL